MSPLIKFGFKLFSNSKRSLALLRGTLKLVAQFLGSVGATLGMVRELGRLNLVIDVRDFGRGSAPLRIRSHNFFEMPVVLTRELALAW
jgi:hypothetical protein